MLIGCLFIALCCDVCIISHWDIYASTFCIFFVIIKQRIDKPNKKSGLFLPLLLSPLRFRRQPAGGKRRLESGQRLVLWAWRDMLPLPQVLAEQR